MQAAKALLVVLAVVALAWLDRLGVRLRPQPHAAGPGRHGCTLEPFKPVE